MSFDSESFFNSLIQSIIYFPNTLKLIFIPFAVGLIIGGIIAFIRFYEVPVLNKILAAFITVYQGVPVMVAVMIYNLLFLNCADSVFQYFHVNLTMASVDLLWIGVFTLSLSAICSMSEVIRGALESVDFGQNEAAYSVGLTGFQTIRRIIIPQIVPVAIPTLTNTTIGLIKNSSVVSVIGIMEVTRSSLIASQVKYTFFEGYLAAAAVYWVFSIFIEFVFGRAEKYSGRYRRTV
ncbi:MAG: amino acid ABC transporter permease [Clostridiales bacterium]|nr:amino acid ABC transporter permease [Clostridiales bacterium]